MTGDAARGGPASGAMPPALLDSLSDGVLVIASDGAVRLANPAFRRMFDLGDADLGERDFGSLFVLREGLDEFTEAVLDAAARGGDVARRLVRIAPADGESRSLTVTAAPLAGEHGTGCAVVVTVSDVTEIRELREREVEQAGVIAAQLDELRGAYRDLEARNEALQALTRRVRTVRGVAAGCVMVLFVGIGAWHLRPLDAFDTLIGAARAPAATAAGAPGAAGDGRAPFVVAPREFSSTIDLRGTLSPGRISEVISPIESHVRAVHAAPGDVVEAGASLVDLDTGPLAAALRQAEVDDIQARERLAELEDWDAGPDMTRARRALRQAEIALDAAALSLDRTRFLFGEGLVPATQAEEAERGYASRTEDVADAVRELERVAAKGTGDALRVVRLQAQSAAERLRAARERADQARVTAPTGGVVIVAEGPQTKPLARGRAVSQGELLLSVADMDRLAVVTAVDEIDLHRVRPGQMAWITGPGFAGIRVGGRVERVATRASAQRGRGGPQFGITVLLDPLDEAARGRVRVGMSAFVTVVVHARPDALLVPLTAIGRSADGAPALRVRDPATGEVSERTVETGLTTLDSVEVTGGLDAGEIVMVPW